MLATPRFSYTELPPRGPERAPLRGRHAPSSLAPLAIRVGGARPARRQLARDDLARRSRTPSRRLGLQVSLAVEGASLAADLHRRQSEARFRSLVAHSSDLITVLDADGVVTYQSPSIERVLGYRADEVEGTQFDRLLSEADRPRLRRS